MAALVGKSYLSGDHGGSGTQRDGMKVETTCSELEHDGSYPEHHCLRMMGHLERKDAVEP